MQAKEYYILNVLTSTMSFEYFDLAVISISYFIYYTIIFILTLV